jgi:hypothetical protein
VSASSWAASDSPDVVVPVDPVDPVELTLVVVPELEVVDDCEVMTGGA